MTFSRLLAGIHAHPRRALVFVFFFVVIAGAVGGPVTGALKGGEFAPANSESTRATERIEDATGRQPSAGILLLVDAADPGDPAVAGAAGRLDEVPGVAAVATAGAAEDGSSVLVTGTLEAAAEPEDVAAEVVEAFAADDGVTVGGGAVAGLQIGTQIESDLGRAELLAFPVLLILSLLIFGGRAAVLPLAVGVTTVLGTFLALMGINQLYGVSVFALVIGLGLGLAIDYTLFLLTRYREELERQGPTLGAIRTTLATAGRTVAYSAATVAVALATLMVFPMNFLRSMGLAGAVVSVVAALAALLVSPAIFALWGRKLARRRSAAAEGRWYRLSHAVMRRPGLTAVVAAALLAVLAAPALRAQWTPVDSSVIPAGESARVVADTLETAYAGSDTTPVTVALTADARAAADFAAAASRLPGVLEAAQPRALDPTTWQLDLEVAGDPVREEARAVVTGLRALAADTGTDALTAGPAAEFLDQQDAIGDTLPLALVLLVGLTLLVLWLMTGSVVLPVKAVVMNALTVGVALGAIVWVYQDGRLTGLLGYTPNGGVEPGNFLVTAALVFALSTDYGVFLLGRIKEARAEGLPEREAVAVGLSRTGAVVTAAALLLAVAIGAFSTSEISFIQQIGVATAVGVLVDAFLVRTFLVPSLMALMGKWNWWAPMWLRAVHDRVGITEGEPDVLPQADAQPARRG